MSADLLKRRRTASVALAVLEVAAVLLLAAWSYRWSVRPGKGLIDYGSFIASGQAANEGLDPYGVYALTFRLGRSARPSPNLNPPISVYPFELAAKLEPARGAAAWYGLSLFGFVVAVALLARTYTQRPRHAAVWAFALAGLWHTLEVGQIYIPLLLCATCAWLMLRKGDDWRAGLAIGMVAAIKPQFAIWPFLLLCSRNWRSGTSAVAMAAVLSTVPLLVDGWHIYEQWLAAVPPMLPAETFAGNSSILAVSSRLGAATAGAFLTVALVLVAAAVAWRARLTPLQSSALALPVAVLVGPLSWSGYTLLLLPVLFAVGWRAAMPAVACLAFPFWAVIPLAERAQPVSFLAGSVYFFGVLALAAILWRQNRDVVACALWRGSIA